MGSAGVGNTTTLSAVRALPDNYSCVRSICWRSPASPPPAWHRTALCLTLLLVGLFTCQSIRTSSTLNAPELRLYACGSARTLDCHALPAAACECWPAESQLGVGKKIPFFFLYVHMHVSAAVCNFSELVCDLLPRRLLDNFC